MNGSLFYDAHKHLIITWKLQLLFIPDRGEQVLCPSGCNGYHKPCLPAPSSAVLSWQLGQLTRMIPWELCCSLCGSRTNQKNELWHNRNQTMSCLTELTGPQTLRQALSLDLGGKDRQKMMWFFFFFFNISCTAISFSAEGTGEHLGKSRALAHPVPFPGSPSTAQTATEPQQPYPGLCVPEAASPSPQAEL